MSMAATAGDSSAPLSPLSSLGRNEAAELLSVADAVQQEAQGARREEEVRLRGGSERGEAAQLTLD